MKKKITLLSLLLCLSFSNSTQAQSDPFIGQISMFAGNFAPRGWAFCDGQLLPISQYSALFSILGTTYGGDGRTTFALPDLRGRVPMHNGNGPGLTSRQLGQKFGSETNTLTVNQMPSHSHTVNAVTEDGNQSVPIGNLPAGTKVLDKEYSNAASNTTMNANMINASGNNQPVNNIQPVLVINYIIALQGVYPSRN
ncbi:phage tail protein [Hwangdonia lutea]|uniref:Tail fiber protein n=1 Tax=Hwangdonia lutea TaxID=3075823 RepID=A0AA97EII3_9FLAO|nr:tail fiber protein [Hwangdonia sp. SCSIO 19198]WOD42074.1 tail fiber protein [Hwangdonia sp. SCSIO 19198]